MSHIALQGDVSGTGKITIQSPNTNFDRTITLPDANGTVQTVESLSANIPAVVFASITGNTGTTFPSSSNYIEIPFSTKKEDTHNGYNTSTGMYTVPIAGIYNINAGFLLSWAGASYGSDCAMEINVDEVPTKMKYWSQPSVANYVHFSISGTVRALGGSSIRILAKQNSGSTLYIFASGAPYNYLDITRIGS